MNVCKSRVCVCSHCIKYATEQSVSQVCAHTMPPDSAHIPESMYRLYVFIRSTELPQRSESAPMLCVYFKRKKSPLVCVKFMRSKSSVSGQRAHTLMSKCTNTPTCSCSAALWRQSLRWFHDLRYQLAGNERKYVYNIHTCSNSSQWVRPWCKISFACISTWLNTSYAE